MFMQSFETLKASPVTTQVSEYTLANGLRLVVVPDTRCTGGHTFRVVSRRFSR